MKSQLLSISFSLLFVPVHFNEKKELPETDSVLTSAVTVRTADILYNDLHLADFGLSEEAFEYGYKGYQHLEQSGQLPGNSLLSICDLSQSSNKKRLYILDINAGKVLLTSYVAHGKGSGLEYATHFSNRANSHQSSLGFYITGNTYFGEHGLSLKLKGLEPGFNDHAVNRNIVIHGARYIGDGRLDGNSFMGRSYGCPAVPQNMSAEIINLMKNGNCLFIYYPTKVYLKRSRILNG